MSTGFTPVDTEGSPLLAMSDPLPGTQPSRAELRRQREAAEEAAALADASNAAPAPPMLPTTRAQRRQAEESAAQASAAPSRAQLRELQQQEAKRHGPLRTLMTAWWVYPIIALVVLFVYLGVRSSQPPSAPPGVEITTPTPIP